MWFANDNVKYSHDQTCEILKSKWKNGITFLLEGPKSFLRDRKRNKKKVAEEYCWAMSRRGSHLTGDQCVGVQI
jgi:hypothetical protein